MQYPVDLKYAENHEWARVEGERVRMGISDYAQDALGDVVYVERLDSPNTLRLFLEVGRRNAAHATGCGKVLLAYLRPIELDRLLDPADLTRGGIKH